MVPADVLSAGMVRPELVGDGIQLVVRIRCNFVKELHEIIELWLRQAFRGTVRKPPANLNKN